MLIVGAWTRLAALVIAFDMVMAVLLALRPQVFSIKSAGGGWAIELEALSFCAAMTLVLAGGGRLALVPEERR